MTTLYGRAGGGNWGDAATWSLSSGGGADGSVPTAADDIILDANSGAVTIDGVSGTPSLCRSLNCTGYTNTLTHGTSKFLQVGDGTTGNIVLVAGMTYVPAVNSATLTLASTTTGNTITCAGKDLAHVTFDGVGGEWTLQDAFSADNVTLTNGSWVTNNQAISANRFHSNNTNSGRSLTLGSSAIALSSTSGWLVNSTGLTFDAGTSSITFSSSQATFGGSGLTYYDVTWAGVTIPPSGVFVTGANTFHDLTVSSLSANYGAFSLNASQTITNTLSLNGTAEKNRLAVINSSPSTPITLTAATLSASYLNIMGVTGAGAADWDLSAITGLSGDMGHNSGITFTTPITCYRVSGANSNWSDAHWFTTSGGAVAARVPLPQDTAIIDANSITAGSVTISLQSLNRAGLPGMNWTGVTNSPVFAVATGSTLYCCGDFILDAGMTITGSSLLYLCGDGAYSIGTGGNALGSNLVVDCDSGSYTQLDNFSCSNNTSGSVAAFQVISGTWNSGGFTTTFTAASPDVTFTGGTFTAGGAFTISGTTSADLKIQGGTLNAAGQTVSLAGAGSIVTLSSGVFNAGTFTRTGLDTPVTGATVSIGAGGMAGRDLTITSGSLTLSGAAVQSGILSVSGTGVLDASAGTIACTSSTHSSSGAFSAGTLTCSSTFAQSGAGTFTAGAGGITATTFTFSGAAARTVNMGAGVWEATSTGTVWNYSGSNVTWNPSTSVINISDTSAVAKTFAGNGGTYGDLLIDGAASNGTVTISGSNTFDTLAALDDADIKFTTGTTQTVSALDFVGSAGHNILLSSTTTTNATINCSSEVDLDYVTVTDMTAAGDVPFYAGNNSTDGGGGNVNWVFTDRPWILSFTEDMEVSDGTVRDLDRGFSEILDYADSTSKGLNRAITEGLSLSEAPKFPRYMYEDIDVGVSFGRVASYVRNISDGMDVLDTTNKPVSRNYEDEITIGESRVRYFYKNITESLTVYDTLLRNANAVVFDLVLRSDVLTPEELDTVLDSPPVGYTPFQVFYPGDYQYTEVMIGVRLTGLDSGGRVGILGLTLNVDVPDVTERGTATVTAGEAAGTGEHTVTFTKTFTAAPDVYPVWVSGPTAAVAEIISVTTTNFVFILRDVSSPATVVEGDISWACIGR